MRRTTRFISGLSAERASSIGQINEDYSSPIRWDPIVFFETDTGKTYINHDGSSWVAVGATVSGASLPAGVIVMWGGLLSAIPTGWALCDGQGGRPDLRSQFIKGAAAGVDPGITGGAATHTHTGHSNHVVTQPIAHSNHSILPHSALTTGADADSTGGIAKVILQTPPSHAPDAHSLHTGTTVDAHSAHASANSEPAYYSLAYIIKT